jgi:two-component system OmpR family sensor kinase
MARIAGESVRMADLVDDLLLLARLDQGRPLRSEPVDLRSIVEEAVADARALEPDRPFETDLTETGVAVVAGDVDRLRQVVANLLANVRVHTTPAAAARIALSVEAGSAVLRVIDHGPGVDSAVAPRVFDRFFRVDDGRSRDRGGAGLGLSIVDSIVTALGGTVGLETTPGGGATFVVRLPIQPGGISS